ncbi:MAG: uroporphyrinogen decarboxylase family protein [Armatimonadota bacterium]
MMTSRERVRAAINHRTPDRAPIDLGATPVSGIAASTLAKLRSALGLPAERVKVHEPFQVLGLVEGAILDLLGVDVLPVHAPANMFGFRNERWKPWQLFDGTEVLVPGDFNVTADERGDLYIYPGGDTSVPPSGHMPNGGFYFDAIVRQEPIDEKNLRPEEWIEGQVGRYSDDDLAFLQRQADHLYAETDRSLVYWFGGGGLGDIAVVPGPMVKHPRGIRAAEDWYAAHMEYPDYIKGIYALQAEIALENLALLRQALGEKIDAIGISGTDFGMQSGPFISPAAYREFFMPHHARINAWVHEHTNWKTMFHSCGSNIAFLDDFVAAGVDIFNPVQCSAAGMDPETLKARWGEKLVFWGGTVDTQRVLPFGTPDEVRAQTAERLRILGKGGGLVAGAIHNIQQNTPVENVIAFFETMKETPVPG